MISNRLRSAPEAGRAALWGRRLVAALALLVAACGDPTGSFDVRTGAPTGGVPAAGRLLARGPVPLGRSREHPVAGPTSAH
jgi:hypothetical protein